MAKIRLKNPVYATFSSYMGVTKFENGVSVDDVPDREARLLGSITAVEIIEDDGSVHNAGYGQINVDGRSKPAPNVNMPKPMSEAQEQPVEINAPPIHVKGKEAPVDETEKAAKEIDAAVAEMEATVDDTKPAQRVWLREELEAIADDKGLIGLREIGDERGLKSNSVETMIHKILNEQRVAKKEKA